RLGRDRLHLWARGDLPAARWLLLTRGATPDRALLELERPLQDLPPAALPPGISLRPFVPGQDDAAWLALHHRCFGWHPEQATWTLADLRARLVQPWFRAAGFLLAEGEGHLRGFVWTKLVRGLDGVLEGEIYIVGVARRRKGGAWAGRSLWPGWSSSGSREWRGRGCSSSPTTDRHAGSTTRSASTGASFTFATASRSPLKTR